jgi:hypothetical protein
VEFHLELLSPWTTPFSPDALARELEREVGPDHALFSRTARALAVARDRDDVLFEIADGATRRYVVVHLTWRAQVESSANVPRTQFFDSLAQWLEWMKADHDDYTHGEQGRER